MTESDARSRWRIGLLQVENVPGSSHWRSLHCRRGNRDSRGKRTGRCGRSRHDEFTEVHACTVRIGVDQTVRWRNPSEVPHTVTANPAFAQRPSSVKLPAGAKPFNSGDMKPGATYSHEFTVAGSYTYFCIPHETGGMIGRVIVTE